MNKITTATTIPIKDFQLGDLFVDPDSSKRIYIMAQVDCDAYAAISLVDGNRFNDPSPNMEAAARGLVLVGRNAHISISFERR